MPLITWEELDKLTTADEIAELLRKHGIKGWRGNSEYCPLACATDWEIGATAAYNPKDEFPYESSRSLTVAQQEFVKRFDDEQYPDLEK